MGTLNGRVRRLEEYIESRVEERVRLEVEALLDVLEANLTREEFVKVARIVIEAGNDGA